MWTDGRQSSRSGMAYWRAGSGPTVLLLHGIPGSAATWQATAEALADRFDVITPDLLGFGASARPTSLDLLHAWGQAAAVEGLLLELDVRRATVVGHDFGGPVALALSARHPSVVGALGLFACNTFTDTPIPFPLATVTWPLVGDWMARVLFSRAGLSLLLTLGAGRPRPALYRAEHLGDRAQQRAIATIFRGSLVRLAELYGPIQAQLSAVDVPTLVGWGDRDPFFPVSQGQLTASALGSTLRLYRGAGHFLPQERPQEIARDITSLVGAMVR